MRRKIVSAVIAVVIGLGLGVYTKDYGVHHTYTIPEPTYGSVALAYASEDPGYTYVIDGKKYTELPEGIVENIHNYSAILGRREKIIILLYHAEPLSDADRCTVVSVDTALDFLEHNPIYYVTVNGNVDNIPSIVNDKLYTATIDNYKMIVDFRRK